VRRQKRSDADDRAQRLRRLRNLFGPSLTEFCRRYQISPSQWANYEAGFNPSLKTAMHIRKQIPGLTLDWIYDGDKFGLSIELQQRLRDDR
jgi:transcriptional regulator with XRE-family HTH domain